MNLTQKAVKCAEFLNIGYSVSDGQTYYWFNEGDTEYRKDKLPESLELVQLIKQYLRGNEIKFVHINHADKSGESFSIYIPIPHETGHSVYRSDVIDGKEVPAWIECFYEAVVAKEKV